MKVEGQGPAAGGAAGTGSAIAALNAAGRRRQAPTSLAEINVTPFVDVVLVLLIIFMITAPMLVRSIDVALPAAGIRQQHQASERIRVTVDREGRTFLDEAAVARELLEDKIRQAVELRGLRVAYLRGDRNLTYGQVMEVVELIKRAGVDQVGLEYVYPEEQR